MPTIDLALIICNQGADRERIVASALKCGLNPICCCNLEEARTMFPQEDFRIVLCSEALSDGDFQSVLREAHRSDSHKPVIVFGHSSNWDSYLKALGAGAFDYIICPPYPMEAETIIWLALADTTGPERASGVAA